jgi:hypothetical protein
MRAVNEADAPKSTAKRVAQAANAQLLRFSVMLLATRCMTGNLR